VTKHREPNRYVVRFTLVGKTYWEFIVFASTSREAIMQAKYDAGRQKIPILECKVEVR